MHLGMLAALPRLTVLNVYHVDWAEDAGKPGLGQLVARLPHLRVRNLPSDVLARLCCMLTNQLLLTLALWMHVTEPWPVSCVTNLCWCCQAQQYTNNRMHLVSCTQRTVALAGPDGPRE